MRNGGDVYHIAWGYGAIASLQIALKLDSNL